MEVDYLINQVRNINGFSVFVEIELFGKILKVDLLKELTFQQETLDSDLQNHSLTVMSLTAAYEQKSIEYKQLEALYKSEDAKLWVKIKQEYRDDAGKVYSDGRTDMELQANQEYINRKMYLLEADRQVKFLEKIIRIFADRKDLMQSLNSRVMKLANS